MSTNGQGSGSLTMAASGTVTISLANVLKAATLGRGQGLVEATFTLPAPAEIPEGSSPFQFASTMSNGRNSIKVRF